MLLISLENKQKFQSSNAVYIQSLMLTNNMKKIGLAYVGSIALVSEYKVTTNFVKLVGSIDNSHNVCLSYELLTI